MKDFNKMGFNEINAEMERFQLQIMRQQAKGIPITPKQMRYFKVLSKAFKRINIEFAK